MPTSGLCGLLVSLIAIASPPIDSGFDSSGPDSRPEGPDLDDTQGRFAPRASDPRASDHQPREPAMGFEYAFPSLRVSNHLIRVFGLERPHLYGLDLQLGATLHFELGDVVGINLEPETGYAFVHQRELDGHAWITSFGVCVLPGLGDGFGVCYKPSFVLGTEARERALGLRHGLGVDVFYVALEAQHGVMWLGSAGARHELRGSVSVDLVGLIWHASILIGMTRGL